MSKAKLLHRNVVYGVLAKGYSALDVMLRSKKIAPIVSANPSQELGHAGPFNISRFIPFLQPSLQQRELKANLTPKPQSHHQFQLTSKLTINLFVN